MKKRLKYIGERIRAERSRQGMSIEELAEAADISDSFLGLVERGVSGLSLESLLDIRAALGVTTDFLLLPEPNGNEDEPIQVAEPTSKVTLTALIKNSTEAEADFILDFYRLFKRHGFNTATATASPTESK